MESNSINIIFEVSKMFEQSNENKTQWMKFISNFIKSSDERSKFYFMLDTTKIKKEEEDFIEISNKEKAEIIDYLKNYGLSQSYIESIKFGLCSDGSKFEDKESVWFFDLDNISIEQPLNNKDSIFFYSDIESGESLYYANFFSYFFDYGSQKLDAKKMKRIKKIVQGFVNDENAESLNFDQINYEFLTFLETEK